MLDFLMVSTRVGKRGTIEIYPKFIIKKSSDLMVRGGDFYAIWDEEHSIWSTNEEVALMLIDKELETFKNEHKGEFEGHVQVLHMWDSDTGMIDKWHKYVQKQQRDNFHALDEKLIFANSTHNKNDYASKQLPYSLEAGETSAWDELVGVLYSPEERHKIEWAIGSIVSGASKNIQKFVVFYGSAGTGKSTIINIIQDLFDGYYCVFDAKALGSLGSSFALEPFKTNPLVAIQHDGDLSRIEDNTRLNSVVSHELMTVNEKFKSAYANRFNCFLFMGTNKPVKITDAKSGILRRLIDVSPTGKKVEVHRYDILKSQIRFELGAIAKKCLDVFMEDPGAYDHYVPLSMMGASNDFYNFVMDSFDVFKEEDGVSLSVAWKMYKEYCEDAKVGYHLPKRAFQEELKNYFNAFEDRSRGNDGVRIRNYYKGFMTNKFEYEFSEAPKEVSYESWLNLNETESLFDEYAKDFPAQYGNEEEKPKKSWDYVTTSLKDLNTKELHYVRIPENLIVVDFDIRDSSGNKSPAMNLEAASKWKKTYAEYSKSGGGIHLHYIYDGDPKDLSRVYDEHIEIKVYTGKSSLRRRLSSCNNVPIAHLPQGSLPLKGDNKVVSEKTIKSERGLRKLIQRNLYKEIMPGTKPSIDFIKKILDDAYSNGLKYDISDMSKSILKFAASSTNHASYCIGVVNQMKFKSESPSEDIPFDEKDPLIFFDVEVFINLFVLVYKIKGHAPVSMINPTPEEVERFINMGRLIGFNNRKYDNHILYARILGKTNEELYKISQAIIAGDKNAFFGEAYNLSYTDIFDFSSKKQSLKKFEIELGIHHQELGLPWDKPVPEELWSKVAEYCINDVVATEATFEARHGDFVAREMLAAIAGMTPNATTNSLTTKIIFGNEKHPKLVYTDLSEIFPGYEYVSALDSPDEKAHNYYRGEDIGFGGYVYSNPGAYGRSKTYDVASMHPNSTIQLNMFGEHTDRYRDILEARIAIKHKDFDKAKKMLGGVLAPYLDDPSQAKALANALKIAINSVYGLTSASFDNPFRDPRNVNNIVALRGALFMVNLKHEIQDRGFKVIHIKTDSIKIDNPTPEIEQFVMEYGKSYGYSFEIEHSFEKICLVNDAVYIAKLAEDDPEEPGKWTATGTQFAVPYVFKTLFSHEPLEFRDLCETKTVTSALYLDFNEDLPEGEHDYRFIGKAGLFCPVVSGTGGGLLVREKDGKYYAATGTKGYRWKESEVVQASNRQADIDIGYYKALADDAIASISEYVNPDEFLDD